MLLEALLTQGVAQQAVAAPAELSAETRIAIAPVAAAIAVVRQQQAKLPPPKDDAERLVRMGQLDQAPRHALGRIDFSRIPAAERRHAMTAIRQQIAPIDEANLKALLEMLPAEGWFTISAYGREAAEAAFHIVQHSDVEQWRRFVPVLEPLAARGEVEGSAFALMFDRLALNEGRPQRYGSQFKCVGGRFELHPLEDPGRVNELRRQAGMPPLEQYLAGAEGIKIPCG